MYLLLLVFGALLTAAGVVLSASGISIHERAFDTTIVTPGIVAVIGGLVLIGLGLALRVLHRIENALATQPMPRFARSKESADTVAALEFSVEPARASIPRTAARTPLSTRPAAASAPPAAELPNDFADTFADTLFPSETPPRPRPRKLPPRIRPNPFKARTRIWDRNWPLAWPRPWRWMRNRLVPIRHCCGPRVEHRR